MRGTASKSTNIPETKMNFFKTLVAEVVKLPESINTVGKEVTCEFD
jgi:hypothetical protein